MLKTIVGFAATALFVGLLTPACASTPEDTTDDSAEELRSATKCGGIAGLKCKTGYECDIAATFPDAMGTCRKSLYFSCTKDSDCVAAPEAECCHSGRNQAVNVHHKTAYEHSVGTCPDVACPLFLIHDTRVAQCGSADESGKRKCEMIAPDAVRCGGFIAPDFQHQCSDGYECVVTRRVPDVPGTCKAIAP